MGKIQWLLGWTSGINDNSKWAIFGKKNSKWAIFGIHKGYIGSIHKYLWYKIIRNTDPMGSRRRRRLYFWLFYIISIYGYSFYTPYIFHIYIYIYIYPGVLRTDRRAGWFLWEGWATGEETYGLSEGRSRRKWCFHYNIATDNKFRECNIFPYEKFSYW